MARLDTRLTGLNDESSKRFDDPAALTTAMIVVIRNYRCAPMTWQYRPALAAAGPQPPDHHALDVAQRNEAPPARVDAVGMIAEQHGHAGRHVSHQIADGRDDRLRDRVTRQRRDALDEPGGRRGAGGDDPLPTLLVVRDDDVACSEPMRSAHQEAVAVDKTGNHTVTRDIDDQKASTRHKGARNGHHKRGKPAQGGEQEL